MPEYLAPAVYVEEVSFRSKPIEGVSTSTTAFVGPTATGPIDDIPELLTGVGDFERIYGGTRGLDFGLNYVAHAVRAFFNNGGRRLYVARAFEASNGTGIATGAWLGDATGAAPNARFVARFPGATGIGSLQLREQRVSASSTNRAPLNRLPIGTMIRTGTLLQSTPSSVTGNKAPFSVPNGSSVTFSINLPTPVTTTVTFTGEAAEVTSAAFDFTTPFQVTSTTAFIEVNVNGSVQTLTIPNSSASVTYDTMAKIADAINKVIIGGFAFAASATTLTIASDVRGKNSKVVIADGGDFHFSAGDGEDRSTSADNVPDLNNVKAEDVAALLAGFPATVTVDLELKLRITTTAVGAGVILTVTDGVPSAAAALGLPTGDADPGEGTTPLTYYVKRETGFQTIAGTTLPSTDNLGGVEILSLNVVAIDGDGRTKNFEDLAYDPASPRYIGKLLAAAPPRRSDALENRFALETNETTTTWPFQLRDLLLGGAAEVVRQVQNGGNDGGAPSAPRFVEAFDQLKSIEDISIIAAPGSSNRGTDLQAAEAIRTEIITFVERRRSYQIAVLDSPPGQVISEIRDYRGEMDSKYAALYYPWVRISNPNQQVGDATIPREIDVPPSGFICGIYARNDAERGVHKAPANEVIRGALSFETFVNFNQQEVLNPAGINALRFFPGRGFRVWGARLASSDPEWKYVSLRRYFNYVEASIDRSTQYVVFEPNGPQLWARIRSSVSDFLFTEWRNGALLGLSPAEAFFVRCDRTTMTQNDLDNGRLIVEVGIAPVNPAEFVIFRIGQKTADARS